MKQSISELTTLTGMDRRKIRKALADISPVKGPKGALLYESTEALPLLYLTPGAGESYDLTAERARLAYHQANKADIECQALAGTLIEVEKAAEIVGNDYANVRAKLLSLPSKASPLLQGLSTVAIHSQLRALISEALEELTADDTYPAK